MTTDERLNRLTGIVETLASAVTAHDSVIEALTGAVTAHGSNIEAHDRQIGALITVAEKNQAAIAELRASSENLERRWQAYLNTLRRQ